MDVSVALRAAMRPDTNGRFTTKNLPPEDYLIIAVQNLESGQASDPEFSPAREKKRNRFPSLTVKPKPSMKLSPLVP